jgi:hypothetical protein
MAKQPEWDSTPEHAPKPANKAEGWRPELNPSQQLVFDSTAKFTLAYGERASGKTVACGHSLVRHCYENKDALAFVIGVTIRTGKYGILHDLESLILPAWRDGNKYPPFLNGQPHPHADEYMDEGIGLDFTASRQDPDTKDRILWIGNRHGGWSMVLIISIPFSSAVEPRIKGPAPSFIYIEELTNCDSDAYFVHTAAQLNRRRGIDLQQWYASANPTGPSSWVYKTFYTDCTDEKTGQRDPAFNVIHVPVHENLHRLPQGHIEHLQKSYRDPIERKRMIEGLWIDRPSGDAIFRPYFMPEIHIVGDEAKGIGWKPLKSQPVIVGMDTGGVNLSIHFLQRFFIAKEQRHYWCVFDEINFVGSYTPYHAAIPRLLNRLDFWNELCGTEFKYTFIAPDDAFNQVNSEGSYDATIIERLGKGRIKLRSCPRGRGSVVERISMVIDMFLDDSIRISATCGKTLQMFRSMISKKAKPGENDLNIGLQPVKSVHLHSFDSMSYPLYFFTLLPGRFPSRDNIAERLNDLAVFFAGEGA